MRQHYRKRDGTAQRVVGRRSGHRIALDATRTAVVHVQEEGRMLSCRFVARPGLSLFVITALAIGACAAEAPPPRPQSAGSAHGGAARPPRGSPAPTGSTSTSLGDSALEPAAVDAAQSDDWPRAESLYRELGRRQPRSGSAKRGLGVALMHQKKNDEAIAMLEEGVRLSDSAGARLDLAAAFAAVDRHPSALPHLRKAVQLAPREPAAWTALSDTLVKVEKPDAAAETLRESRKVCPRCAKDDGWMRAATDVARALVAKAEKHLEAGDRPAARKAAEGGLALRADLPEGQLALGKVARAEGDNKAAATAFRKAVEQMPDAAAEPGAGARLELATLLMVDGNGAEAVKLAEQVVAARGADGAALDTLGRACDATRNLACARKAYSQLAKMPVTEEKSKNAVEHARVRMKELTKKRRR